ncbi:MAG: asparagine synthetase B [Candidatus Bathyarchaeia archaeon]
MGALVSIVSKHGRNVVKSAVKMLSALRHRGTDLHGISTGKITVITKDIGELNNLPVESSIVLGYNFSHRLPNDIPQPIEVKNFRVIFDGRIFSPCYEKTSFIDLIEQSVEIEETLKNIIREVRGSFSFMILDHDKLFVGRDPIGAIPLYFCENDQFYALASERKALWLLGMKNDCIKSFPPGNLAKITSEDMRIQPVKILERSELKYVNEREAIEKMYNLLLRAVEDRIADLERVSISFSGGLDSSIIAALVREKVKNALLISVGLEGSRDLENAEKIAGEIGLPFKAETYTPSDVVETLPRVLWLIEEANALKASICIPEFWSAETSSRMGYRVMLSGQGSDEIFAGYHKYLKEYSKSPNLVEQTLYHDTLKLYKNSLEPEEKICSFHNVEARFPYADFDLASFALSLPITLKISSSKDPLRKRILRRLAEYIGLPADVYLKPKKAIQYGTGVSQALKKIAKENGLNMQSFINQVFKNIVWIK